MATNGELRVSSRGQMNLPASTRNRWGLTKGGQVAFLDLGDALVLVPGGAEALRRSVIGAVSERTWEEARAGFGDGDLATQ